MSRNTKTLTRSFAGGEMSPEMFSRVDDVMFQAGAETMLNCIPRPTGATARRPGTRLIRETRDATKIAHLLSFVFSPTQSVVIEGSRATIGGVEGGYFRFHQNGGTLLYSQPDRFVRSLTVSANNGFVPCRTVQCNVASPMVVTLTDHGLREGDQVLFISSARTIPNGFTALVYYYVRIVDGDSFNLSATLTGALIACTSHYGYNPVLYNWSRWRISLVRTARNIRAAQNIMVSEHRVPNKAPVVLTMWPTSFSPTVTFSESTFRPSPTADGYGLGLHTIDVRQQVMFVPDGAKVSGTNAGAVLPDNIEEGRLYWTTAFSNGSWTISETYQGAAHDVGGGGVWTSTSHIRMCAMPLIANSSLGEVAFGALTRYYAITGTDVPNTLRLEASIGAGQVVAGGFEFNAHGRGAGPFRIHRTYEVGDIASFADTAGNGLLNFYAQKNWWDPDLLADRNLITLEMHDSDGARIPGARTSAEEGAYWRELAGRTTGDAVGMKPREYTGSGDLTIDSISGTGHGFETDTAVAFVDGTQPDPLALDTVYYAIKVSSTQIKLSLTKGGAAVTGPDAATPRHGGVIMEGFVSFDTTSHEVGWPAHGLSNGDTVVFSENSDYVSATIQTPLALGTVYYVREKTTGEFRVSSAAAGPLIDFTGSAGSLVSAVGNSIYEVPHDYSEEELPKIITTQSGDVMTMTSQDHPVTELRRLSSTKWEMIEPDFIAAVDPPAVLSESSIVPGEGTQIIATGTWTTFSYFVTKIEHTFTPGTPVYLDGFPTSGVGSLAAGYYITGHPPTDGSQEKHIWINTVESSDPVVHGGDATGLGARIRYGTQGEERTQKYVVTSIDKNNEESAASDSLEVSNNLFVSGASNTIGWGGSLGAVRYRVYKELSGLYGLIGETDELTFKDDNIGPDLAVSPPIPDSSLRQHARITFNATADTVNWTDHGFSARMPVVFKTSDEMPGIEEGKTYFVFNPGTDEFQVTDDPDSDTPVDITGTDTGNHSAVIGNFPATTTHFEGRRVFGGSRALPQDIWMTASGTESDLTYSIPTVDSDRIYFRVASREISSIRHLIPLSQLVLLSDSTEYRLTPANDDALTPASISVRPQSYVGADRPHPSLVNNTVVFAAARGGHMRELGYSREVLGYLTGDLSIRAAHLFDGFTIVDQAYSKAPLPVVWCVSSSGKLLGITYIPEENVGAWHQHTTPADGVFESVAVVPEGDEDAVYVVVQRTINGQTNRYVERFADEYRGDTTDLPDAFFVDCGLTYDGASTTSIAGLDHLEGETVSYLADGVVGTGTVTSGTLTLSTAATKVHVGLGFTSQIKTLPLSMMRVDAFGSGRQKNINQVWVRVFQSGAFETGPTAADLRPSLNPAAGALLTDLVQVTLPGLWDDDGQVFIQQATPLPLTVSGLTIEVASGG